MRCHTAEGRSDALSVPCRSCPGRPAASPAARAPPGAAPSRRGGSAARAAVLRRPARSGSARRRGGPDRRAGRRRDRRAAAPRRRPGRRSAADRAEAQGRARREATPETVEAAGGSADEAGVEGEAKTRHEPLGGTRVGAPGFTERPDDQLLGGRKLAQHPAGEPDRASGASVRPCCSKRWSDPKFHAHSPTSRQKALLDERAVSAPTIQGKKKASIVMLD